MLLAKQKKSQNVKRYRLSISINVLESAGPIRFVVEEEEPVDAALKSYAREGRLPVLGSKFDDFLLYCPNIGPDALSPWDTIGSPGARNFMLCKKPPGKLADGGKPGEIAGKGRGSWKCWIHRSFNRKITSH